MNVYDHEDAFKDANLCAANKVKIAEALRGCTDRHLAISIIGDAQTQYQKLFDAFIEGVAYGREHPLKTDTVLNEGVNK